MVSELGLTGLIGTGYTAKKRCAGSRLPHFLTPAPSVSHCGVTSPVLQLQELGWGRGRMGLAVRGPGQLQSQRE